MRFSKVKSAAAILSVYALSFILSAAAYADTPITSNTGTNGPQVTFDKYLVMKSSANVPNASFSFSVSSGAAVAAGQEATEIFSGIEASKVAVSDTAVFAPGDATSSVVKEHDTLTLAEGEKYADKQVTLDFGDITYTVPGIYRYVVTETPVDPENGFTITDGNKRYLDIYIESDENGILSCAGTVLHRTTEIINQQGGVYDGGYLSVSNAAGTKPTGFTNQYTTYDLYLEKQVKGNQGDRNAYFAFTVEINGAIGGTVYDVILPAVANNSQNPSKLTCDGSGSVTATYYLKDNQQICIQGLTANTSYKITELLDDGKGYTVSYKNHGSEGNGKVIPETKMDDGTAKDDNYVLFTNRKNGIIPTGIFLDLLPYIILMILAAAGLFLIGIRRTQQA